ncbi:MAG: recombinase family protein [Anaerolineaceae bacterium]|nr:recombinase family protein [Anaerolineaceae bacterium]
MMSNAIIYCRSATADQQSDAQLSRQKEDCLAYARAHGYEVIEIISEAGFSGLDQSRQGLQKLFALCDENEIKAVITRDIERLSRDRHHFNNLMQAFADKRIELVTLNRF